MKKEMTYEKCELKRVGNRYKLVCEDEIRPNCKSIENVYEVSFGVSKTYVRYKRKTTDMMCE